MSNDPLVKTQNYERAAGFTQVSNIILRGYPELRAEVKLTYMVLDSFAWKSRHVFPGLETLARARDLAPETVSRHIHELQEVGLVEITQRGRKQTNSYYLPPIPPERVDAYLEEWGQSDLTRGSSHSESDLSGGSSHPPSDLTRGSSPQEEDEGTTEEDEGRAPPPAEDLRLIGESADKPSTRCGLRLQSKLRRFSGRDLKLVCTYLEIAASDARGNAASDQGKCSRVDVLVELLATHGHAAWIHGLEECRRLGKAGDAYVTAIIQGYDPGAAQRSRSGVGSAISDDGPTIIDEIWEREHRERAEALRREREGGE